MMIMPTKNWTRAEEYELAMHAAKALAARGSGMQETLILTWEPLARRMGRKPEELRMHACTLGLHLWHTRNCFWCEFDAMARGIL